MSQHLQGWGFMNHTVPEQTDLDKGTSWDRFKQNPCFFGGGLAAALFI